MTSTAPRRKAALPTAVVTGAAASATARTTAVDTHHPAATLAQAETAAAPEGKAAQGKAQHGTMPHGMMDQGTMGQGMMRGMMQPDAMGSLAQMRGLAMKLIFAIADTDGDGVLSFEDISTTLKRIFDKVDADKDGKVTLKEIRDFMRE